MTWEAVTPCGSRGCSEFDAGLDATARERFIAYRRELKPAGNPIWSALRSAAGRLVTRSRRQLVSDAEWYRSALFTEYRRPGRIDHQLTSIYRTSDDGAISVMIVLRALGERDFSPREQRLLNFFHAELGPLIGRRHFGVGSRAQLMSHVLKRIGRGQWGRFHQRSRDRNH